MNFIQQDLNCLKSNFIVSKVFIFAISTIPCNGLAYWYLKFNEILKLKIFILKVK